MWIRGMLHLYNAAHTLPHSRRIGGGSLTIPSRDSVGPHSGVDTAQDSSSLASIFASCARSAWSRLHTSPRQRPDISRRFFRKILVGAVSVIHPIRTDDFANGMRRRRFFCGAHAAVAFLRTACGGCFFANNNTATAIFVRTATRWRLFCETPTRRAVVHRQSPQRQATPLGWQSWSHGTSSPHRLTRLIRTSLASDYEGVLDQASGEVS